MKILEFKDAGKFFNWVSEVAASGGIKIERLGTHDGKYWVTYNYLEPAGGYKPVSDTLIYPPPHNKRTCKYIRREGESCTLNDNCKFPNCEVELKIE